MADDERSLYARLKRLFSSQAVVRIVGKNQLKVVDTDSIQGYGARGLMDKYRRVFMSGQQGYNPTGRYDMNAAVGAGRLQMFRDYDIMDRDPIVACISGDTRIMTLEGPRTIRELSDSWVPGNTFEVWAWDTTTCKYVIGQAHHPRKTGTSEVLEIVLDNGEIFSCTPNHRVMLIDGTYEEAQNLTSGSRIMPFEYKNREYMHVRIPNGQYIPAHRYVSEHVLGQDLTGKNVHHINHKKYDNRTSNLQIMDPIEHLKLHGISDITNRKRGKTSSELWKDPVYRSKARAGLQRWRASDEGHAFMSAHATHLNKTRWVTDIDYATKMAQIFSIHAKQLWSNPEWKMWKKAHHSMTMKLKYANDPSFRERVVRTGVENGRYNNSITNEWILATGIGYDTLTSFAQHEKFESLKLARRHICQFIHRRLREAGYTSWSSYKESYSYTNHQVVEVRRTGVVMDVYDLSVDHFENFAIEQGIIISNSVLDIYADECTVQNEFGRILNVTSPHENIQEILNNLFYDILNVEFNLWPWTRNMAKYGDLFMYLHIDPEYGVTNVIPLSIYETYRIEGDDPQNPFSVKFKIENDYMNMFGKKEFENFEIAHFRLLSDSNFLPYGRSMLEGARRVHKQLMLMEDAMLIHRIMRAPDKRKFIIDVGNIPPAEVEQYMQRLMDKTKKIPLIDEKTGEYNLRYNMQNILEDFYFPVRGKGSSTDVTNLQGLQYNAIEDIEYLRKKLLAAFKVPNSFLGYEEDVCIHPETKIELLNGQSMSVKDIISDYERGIKHYVYSIDPETLDVVPGEIEWAGYTRKNAKVVRVILDNDESITCTPDHRFMMRDGSWKEAQDLINGDSVMPLYLDKTNTKTKKGYTTVYRPIKDEYQDVHRLVAEHYNLIERGSGLVVHHMDFDKKNNYPDNLDCSMNWWEHRKFHQNLIEKTLNSTEAISRRMNDPEYRKHLVEAGKKGGLLSGHRLGAWVRENGPSNKGSRSGQIKVCLVCDNEFYVTPVRSTQKCCSRECTDVYHVADRRYNCKFFEINLKDLMGYAGESKSFAELENKLSITRRTLNRVFKSFDINKRNFVIEHMPLSHDNVTFINNLSNMKNHKIKSVERVEELINTCDIRVSKYHNFGVSAGIFIHNSGKATLSAQDVRFARTIERIQRILISELTKIAIVHLYVQGFRDEKLVEFDLALTNPSTIYEQEKVALWKDKISLANDLQTSKFISRKWIYENILELTDREREEVEDDVKKDAEFLANLQAMEQKILMQAQQPPPQPGMDGGAPEEPATTTSDEDDDEIVIEPEIGENGKLGRPAERRLFGTDRHPGGRDPLGNKENRKALHRDPHPTRVREFKDLVTTLENANKFGKPRTEPKEADYLNEDNILELEL